MTGDSTRGGHPGSFDGPGQMRALYRSHAWDQTPLGAIKDWPVTLRVAANPVLASPTPTTLQWGPKSLFLYNDAYAALAGVGAKHPTALGSR